MEAGELTGMQSRRDRKVGVGSGGTPRACRIPGDLCVPRGVREARLARYRTKPLALSLMTLPPPPATMPDGVTEIARA